MSQQTRQNILFSLFMLALGMFINILHTMSDRMALSLGWVSTQSGLLVTIYAIGSLISIVLSSSLADKVGKRRVIITALAVMFPGLMLIFLSHTFLPMALGLFLFGLGFGPSEGQASAVISDENPLQAAKWMNIVHAGFGMGAIIAPILAVAVAEGSGSHHLVFLICGLTSLLFLLLIRFTGSRKAAAPSAGARVSPLDMFHLLKDRQMAFITLMIFLYLGYEAIASSYIKQFFILTDSSESLGAVMVSLFWAVMILARLIGASLYGREYFSIRLFSAIAVAGILLLVLAPSRPLRILAVALYGFGCGPVWPMLMVIATRLFPERSGAATGLIILSTMAGLTVFPTLIGTLPGNLNVTFVLAALLAALVLALSFFAQKHHRPQADIERSAP